MKLITDTLRWDIASFLFNIKSMKFPATFFKLVSGFFMFLGGVEREYELIGRSAFDLGIITYDLLALFTYEKGLFTAQFLTSFLL